MHECYIGGQEFARLTDSIENHRHASMLAELTNTVHSIDAYDKTVNTCAYI